ncbi:hypothetical protein [Spirosoma panaciterrae]|uniref:hypothetical protein n=1 Tax=Spirosoma panaciterrae TaxID=496058 RepID=UPI0003627DC3|nr:hypothetical protein [Spirosoma panaciterrae]
MAERTTIHQLTQTDILITRPPDDPDKPRRGYVVRRIWQKPVVVPNSNFLHYKIVGFTLFDTADLVDKEVSAEELQDQLDNDVLTLFTPQTVRQVKGLTPRDYHKPNNGKIRQAS